MSPSRNGIASITFACSFVGLLQASTAHAATCTFDAAGQHLDVVLGGDNAVLGVSPTGAFSIGGNYCGGATTATVRSIQVVGTGANERFNIDISRHALDSKILLSIDLGGGTDMFTVYCGNGNDRIAIGELGMNLNSDVDTVDVTLANVEGVTVSGSGGNDLLTGDGGYGTGGPTTIPLQLSGGDGDDVLMGGKGADVLYGDAGNDVLIGGDGNDQMTGGMGNDYMDGGAGDDLFKSSWYIDGDDTMIGGDGRDTVSYAQRINPVYISLDGTPGSGDVYGEMDVVGADIENAYGGAGDDCIIGNASANQLFGGDSDDWIDGGAGDDVIYGGNGDDVLLGGDGNDHLYGNAGNDYLFGGDGNDILDGGDGDDTFTGGPGRNSYLGGSGYDILMDSGSGISRDVERP